MRRDERLEMRETRKTEEFDLFHRKIDLVLQKQFFNEKSIVSLKSRFFQKNSIFFIITLDSGNPICASYSFENVSVGEIWGVGNLGEWGNLLGKAVGKIWGNIGEIRGGSGGKSGRIWVNLEGIWGWEG